MKTIKVGDVTVITTTFNKKENGITEVLVDNNNYDNMYDQNTLDTDCKENTINTLKNVYKTL